MRGENGDSASKREQEEIYRKISAYAKARDFQKAVDDSTAMIAKDAKDAWAYCIRGWALSSLGEHNKAISDLSAAITLKKDYVLAYSYRAFSYEKTGHLEEALGDYDRVARLAPSTAACNRRARLRMALGQTDEALDDLLMGMSFNRRLWLILLIEFCAAAALIWLAVRTSTPAIALGAGWVLLLPLLCMSLIAVAYHMGIVCSILILKMVERHDAKADTATNCFLTMTRAAGILPLLRLLLPHALHNRSLWLFYRRDYKQCLAIAEERLQWQRKHHDDRGAASTASWLGTIHSRMGDMAAAEAMLDNACAVLKRLCDRDPSSRHAYSSALLQKSLVLKQLRRYAEALQVAEEALSIQEELACTDREKHVHVSNVAVVLLKLRKLDEAEPLLKKALAMARASERPKSKAVAMSLNNIGYFHILRGQLDEAEPYFTEALAAIEALPVTDRGTTGWLLGKIGLLRFKQGRYDESEKFFLHGIEDMSKHSTATHPSILDTLENYHELLVVQKRTEDADKIAARCAEIVRKYNLPVEAPTTHQK